MLKGKLVLLRPLQRTDIQYFLKWFNDPEVMQYSGMYLPITEMAEEKYFEELATSRKATDVDFVIEAIDGDKSKPIGSLGFRELNNKDCHATLGISIGEKEYWGKGYGSEAARMLIKYGFEQLNLHRISSSTWSFNERSIKFHLKLGFHEEGRRREWIYKNGAYHDEVMFGLLKEDWEKLK